MKLIATAKPILLSKFFNDEGDCGLRNLKLQGKYIMQLAFLHSELQLLYFFNTQCIRKVKRS
jgi:hypothetical protein